MPIKASSSLFIILALCLIQSICVGAIRVRQDTLARVISLAQGKLNKNNPAIAFPIVGQNTVLLSTNEAALKQNQRTWSPNKSFYLSMQEDGNLVLYTKNDKAVWASGTYGKGTAPYNAIMQKDNNFVVYDSLNKPLWSSNTFNKDTTGAYLAIQNDGYIGVYDGNDKLLWTSEYDTPLF